ncbi:Vacuolar protein sorting-associated protein 4B [Araneus ventricosus]|uniref:Vacuolar protein sorting-associated protein 4B n=1 Tax=Araneus ventricosus TaxID=182803 RepID=A0A4Y2LK26_ARAVE|nr:Vacuolar protein sorting-associated protein 4B [Araneus ventricosus]
MECGRGRRPLMTYHKLPPGTGKTYFVKKLSEILHCELAIIGPHEFEIKKLQDLKQSPGIIMLEEIDAYCRKRSPTDTKQERLTLNGILLEIQGLGKDTLLISTTNHPQSIDDAVLRRLQKKICIQLPNSNCRVGLMRQLLSTEQHTLTNLDFKILGKLTKWFSRSDISRLINEALMLPIREITSSSVFIWRTIEETSGVSRRYVIPESRSQDDETESLRLPINWYNIQEQNLWIPPITMEVLLDALNTVKPDCETENLKMYDRFTEEHGHVD